MSCTLSSGRKVPCKSSVGGLKTIYFADYGTLGTVSKTGSNISTISAGDWYQFDVKGNSSLETSVTSSRENGTTFYETTLNMTLTYLDAATQEQIKILAHGRPHVAVEDYNGNVILAGLEHGCEVTGGTIVTGAAMGDLSGFTLTMLAQETDPPYFVAAGQISGEAAQIDPTTP